MKVSYNFLSLVALGNFNPAIVTTDFLNNVCDLNLGDLIKQSDPNIPVHRFLEFSRFKFIADINKFQILQEGIKGGDIPQSNIVEIFDAYYEKLPHTPLDAVGVNINCDLIAQKGGEFDKLVSLASDPRNYLDFFRVEIIDVTERSLQTSTEKKWMSSHYYIKMVQVLARRVNIDKKTENSLGLNYNCEVGDLKKDSSRLGLLSSIYDKYCDEFTLFLKRLGD